MAAKKGGEEAVGYAQSTLAPPNPLEIALNLATETPLLAIGRVVKRQKLSGKGDRGPWEMYVVEIRANSGSNISITVNDPKNVPAVGEIAAFNVFVDRSGRLRETRDFGTAF